MLAGVGVTHGDWTLVPVPCVSSKNILTKRLKAYCDYAAHIHCLNPAFITGKEKDGERIMRRAEGVLSYFYYVQSVQDYENRLAEKNNQRPDPEEQVLIF